jgi:hypothetical protein
MAGVFTLPVTCDGEGNIYFRVRGFADKEAFPIEKVNLKGEHVATFYPDLVTDPQPDLTASYSVDKNGDLYLETYAGLDRYVLVFGKDGALKSKIKLLPGFDLHTSQVAGFPSGQILVAGQEEVPVAGKSTGRAFTGVFGTDGKLIKEVRLQDDERIKKAADVGDSEAIDSLHPEHNQAIELGSAISGDDGNVYLLRHTSPAVIYAISPAGEVVKRITVDPGQPGAMPLIMQVAKGEIAVMFDDHAESAQVFKIVDLDGHELATYRSDREINKPPLGMAFACFMPDKHELAFVENRSGKVAFDIAVPK